MKKHFLVLSLILSVLIISLSFVGCNIASADDKRNAKIFTFESAEYMGENGYSISKYLGSDQSVVIPATYKSKKVFAIEPLAFADNNKITSVSIGKNIKTIGLQAFAGASNLKNLTFGNDSNVVHISEKAFYCTNLSGELSLPERLQSIGASAFENCSSITKISLCASTIIDSTAFKNYSSITRITITGGIDDISQLVTSMVNFDTIGENRSSIEIEINNELKSILKDTIVNLGFLFVE